MNQLEIKSYVTHLRTQLYFWDSQAGTLSEKERSEYQIERDQLLEQVEVWDAVATADWSQFVAVTDARITALQKKWGQVQL
jgi:hypothetical protein